MNGGAIILAIGAAGAIYLWYRSQQAQAAALAAAQGSGPGLVGRAENSLRGIIGAVPLVGSAVKTVVTDAVTLDFLQYGTPIAQQDCGTLCRNCTTEKMDGRTRGNGVWMLGNGPYCSEAKAKGCSC